MRYFTLTNLLDRPADDREAIEARQAVMASGPVPTILAAQHPDGYWVKPGAGYNPKYRSTVWSVILLAQLGSDGTDPRVRAGCEYVLSHSIASSGAFSTTGAPSPAILCLGGNLAASLIDLGWWGDEQLHGALEWLARAVTGEGIAPAEDRHARLRYYRSGTAGPGFRCAANNKLPCAWGAVKVMLALSRIPQEARTPVVQRAIEAGVDYLLSTDPALADYPAGWGRKPGKKNRSWFRFGFPIFYVTDVLQNLEASIALGYAADPRLANAIQMVLGKQDAQGRWPLEYHYHGKTWADTEAKKRPSKWITLRALRVLKGWQAASPVVG